MMEPQSSHHSALRGICRLCGQAIKRRSITKHKLASVIFRALSLDVSKDSEDIHPPDVCELCDRKLVRWRDSRAKKGKKKGGLIGSSVINIKLAEYGPHGSNCSICRDVHHLDKCEEQTSLLNECEKVGNAHGMIVHHRSGKVLLVSLDDDGNTIKCLSVRQSGHWSLRVYGQVVPVPQTELKDIPECVTIEFLQPLIKLVSESHICPGNPEYLIPASAIANKPVYIHSQPQPLPNTMRHISCPVLTSSPSRCTACRIYRSDLATFHKSFQSTVSPAPKANYRYMKKEKLTKRLRAEKQKGAKLEQQLTKLKAQISKKFNDEATLLDEGDSKNFMEVIGKGKEEINKKFAAQSPQRLLWDEQLKQASREAKGMRWHPAVLRLCIALHAKSASAYDLLKKSGFLHLPHQKTLFHYTHFMDNSPGYNMQFLQRISKDIGFVSLKDHEKNVMISLDEMKISEGLVFSQKTGEIIGFTSLGSLNSEFEEYTRKCEEKTEPKMASHVLVLMIRGITASYMSPIAYFATVGATSDQLYHIVFEAVEVLTHLGFHVRGIVCDGAAPNRGLYKILTRCSPERYYFVNPISGQKIYIFSDAPHLMKTVRNNVENSGYNRKTRNLMFRGKSISWKHFIDVYEWDFQRPSSLRMLHRLTEEHLHLNPALRMKVKLACQVLSSSVGNALRVQGLEQTSSTIMFVEYFDMFFDCLNVSTLDVGHRKRKDALFPYKDINDWRFTWLIEDFLSFVDEWESEGTLLHITAKERERLCLSRQTLEGIRMTVNSFVALCKELLQEEGVKYVLSDKFNQDPLEQYFAKQRSIGRQHENPSLSQFGNNMLSLHVAGSCIRTSKRANVSTDGETSIDSNPIPRKRLFKAKKQSASSENS